MARDSRCPECGEYLDESLPECAECGAAVKGDEVDFDVGGYGKKGQKIHKKAHHKLDQQKPRMHVPWGLFIILALYFGGVWGYVRYEYYYSPKYIAAKHLRSADQLLGGGDGGRVSLDALKDALDHLIQALNAFPEDTWTQTRIEGVVRHLKERGEKLTKDQQHTVDSLALTYRRNQDAKTSFLPIGARDIWDVDSVLDMPNTMMRNSVVGGLFILAFWLYRTIQDRKHLHALALERDAYRSEEIDDLGVHRKRKKAKG